MVEEGKNKMGKKMRRHTGKDEWFKKKRRGEREIKKGGKIKAEKKMRDKEIKQA